MPGGFAHFFTPSIIEELKEEDKILEKLEKARSADDFTAFKRVHFSLAQFYSFASMYDEGLLLVDNRIAISEVFRKVVLNHLHKAHTGQQKIIDTASYIW